MEIKVGDKLRLKEWSQGDFIEVLFVGKERFFGLYSDAFEMDYMILNDWLPYEEPKNEGGGVLGKPYPACSMLHDCQPTKEFKDVEPKKKVLMAPAIIKSADGYYLISISLYASKKDAETQQYNSFYSFIYWPAIPNKDGFYEVEGELVE